MLIRLTQLIIGIIVVVALYYVMLKLLPKKWLTIFGGVVLVLLILLAFWNPNAAIIPPTSQILSAFFQPLGIILLILSIGLSQMKAWKIEKNGTILIMVASFLLLVCSLPIVAYQLAQQMETEVVNLIKTIEYCPEMCNETAGVIVVLGQGTTEAPLPYRRDIQLTDRSDRIFYAANIYNQQSNQGNSPLVIVSAGKRLKLRNQPKAYIEAEDIEILLNRLGVPRSNIILESHSVNLRTSATEVKAILTKNRLAGQPIYLVTSAINMSRALQAFRQQDLYVFPRPTDFYTFQNQATPRRQIQVDDFIPSVEALAINSRILEEFFGSLYYFLRGWLTPII